MQANTFRQLSLHHLPQSLSHGWRNYLAGSHYCTPLREQFKGKPPDCLYRSAQLALSLPFYRRYQGRALVFGEFRPSPARGRSGGNSPLRRICSKGPINAVSPTGPPAFGPLGSVQTLLPSLAGHIAFHQTWGMYRIDIPVLRLVDRQGEAACHEPVSSCLLRTYL